MKTRLAAVLWGLTFAWAATSAQAAEPLPLFDAHLHYNVEAAQGPYPLDHVLKLFRDNRVTGILANSRPNDGTRALYEAKPKDVWGVPFIRPYIVQPDRFVVGSDTLVNERLGQYAGIMNGYRDWLAELPKDVAEKIAFRNAERLFRK